MNKIFLLLIGLVLLGACQENQKSSATVDLIVHNAKIYTVDSSFTQQEAFAVQDGKFVAVGTSDEILAKYSSENTVDAQGKPLYPGLIDAHCHFYRYGLGLRQVDLVGTQSFEEILEKLQAFRKENPDSPWLVGRGWDQNDWEIKEFPDKLALDSLFPDTPVYLTRVDGHAALANQKALELAGINANTLSPEGGAILKNEGRLSGILIDKASRLVASQIPSPNEQEQEKALLSAQENCFAVGLTSVQDAGLSQSTLEKIEQMNKANSLKMRMYAMVSSTPEDIEYYLEKGPSQTPYLNIRSFKIYADGALGSRGACLLEPYADRPEEQGFLLSSPDQLEAQIKAIAAGGFQVNTHCIGDSANRFILDMYSRYLPKDQDNRWRIEHAQVINAQDFAKFGEYQIIPSVQPTHTTSDMFWALDRLGEVRAKGAYAFKDLLAQNQLLAFGSDFPVEDINPLYGFHAAVVRKNAEGKPEEGFQMENALSREQALKGMTIWAAYAAFEEGIKGSIEVGKMADFVILEEDIMEAAPEKLRGIKTLSTFVNGEKVYSQK